MGKKISGNQLKSKKELMDVIEKTWNEYLNQDYLNKLYCSMPYCQAVLKAKGGATKY